MRVRCEQTCRPCSHCAYLRAYLGDSADARLGSATSGSWTVPLTSASRSACSAAAQMSTWERFIGWQAGPNWRYAVSPSSTIALEPRLNSRGAGAGRLGSAASRRPRRRERCRCPDSFPLSAERPDGRSAWFPAGASSRLTSPRGGAVSTAAPTTPTGYARRGSGLRPSNVWRTRDLGPGGEPNARALQRDLARPLHAPLVTLALQLFAGDRMTTSRREGTGEAVSWHQPPGPPTGGRS
jgi:hypothetical protein